MTEGRCPRCGKGKSNKAVQPKKTGKRPTTVGGTVRQRLKTPVLLTTMRGKEKRVRFETLLENVYYEVKSKYRREPSSPETTGPARYVERRDG